MKYIAVPELIDALKREGLVLVPAAVADRYIKDKDLEHLQKEALKLPALTYKQIADAKLWGDIGKMMVSKIASAHKKPGEVFVLGNKHKVTRDGVMRIARIRKLDKKAS